MKTYKVTYYTKGMEIAEVTTYHNIDSQGALVDWIWNNIQVREYLTAIKCTSEDGKDYTEVINRMFEDRQRYPELWEN